MSQRISVLQELQDELERAITAADRRGMARRPRRPRPVLSRLGTAIVVLASVAAVAVVVSALSLVGHGHRSTSHTPASSAGTRGAIVGRHGTVLADTTRVATISVRPAALPPSSAARVRLYQSLARALAIHGASRRCVLGGEVWLRAGPCQASATPPESRASLITVAEDVQGGLARRVLTAHLSGVVVRWSWARSYPGDLGAQALGLVTAVSSAGGAVGRAGLEATYDRYLRAGDNLSVSLGASLQRVGEAALKTSERANGAPGGSFVAMNPENGQIYAMGSSPTYDASIFGRPGAHARLRNLTRAGDSLLNRATQSAGPAGSVFAPLTAAAALASGQWTSGSVFDDTGQFCVGTGQAQQCRHNSGHAVYGRLNLVDALRVSSDDFFYNLGAKLNVDPITAPNGGPLDQRASAFGIGRHTGVDLPGETSGTLPTPAWRQHRNTLEAECDRATGPFAFTNGKALSAHDHAGWHRSPKHPPGGCRIADGTNRPWSIGDNESLAVGQGDVQVTPLQVAVAYAALANGGTVVRPHLGVTVNAPDGTVVRTINPPPARHLSIDSAELQTIRQGLHEAAQSPGGTSDDVMGGFPMTVYGKAGSAQYVNQPDSAWYAGFVIDHTNTPIVVVVHIEKGGFGDVAAAPVARQILSQWFLGKPGKYITGTSSTL